MRTFVDTNVLVYAHDRGEPAKRERALAVLAATDRRALVLSTQVLSEFYVATTRPQRQLLSREAARRIVTDLLLTPVEPVDADLVRRVHRLHASHSLSYWDALVVGAAARAGCQRLLTEDLQAGQVIDGVRVENPFVV